MNTDYADEDGGPSSIQNSKSKIGPLTTEAMIAELSEQEGEGGAMPAAWEYVCNPILDL